MTTELHYDKKTNILRLQGANELNAFRMYTIDEVIDAHELLTDYLAKNKLELIGAIKAREIAAEEGYDIPQTTLVNAAARGTIQGARKRGSRWLFPRAYFDIWFSEWKARRAKKEEAQA